MASHITISKPIGTWNKSFNFNYRKLFVTVGKLAVNTATCNISGVLGDVLELVNVADLKDKPWQDIAWAWMTRAMGRAVISIIDQNQKHLNFKDSTTDLERISQQIEDAIADVTIEIHPMFFNNPRPTELLQAIEEPFKNWLVELGADEKCAAFAASRIPDQFVIAFHEEWVNDPAAYKKVTSTIQAPTSAAYLDTLKWREYRARLAALPQERVFDENFCIEDVYIDLRAAFEVAPNDSKESRGRSLDEPKETIHRATMLLPHLEEWVKDQGTDKSDCARLVHGDPGCGKSTFAKQLAAQMANDHAWKTLFIPLHRFNVEQNLISALDTYCSTHHDCPANPLAAGYPDSPVFIIFDGLDELSESGTLGAKAADKFIESIRSELSQLNEGKIRLKVLILGRDIAIQEQRGAFGEPGQILTILPYRLLSEDKITPYHTEFENKDYFDDPDKILHEDQRDSWWVKYGKATGVTFTEAPPELKTGRLDDITAQPLLNYLVSLCMEDGKLDFDASDNLNTVYHRLLRKVHGRNKDKPTSGSKLPDQLNDFSRIMEEIAITAWHDGSQRSTSFEKLKKRSEISSSFKKLFDRYLQEKPKGLVTLLTAFYCRESNSTSSDEYTYEFTHKSFREFLTVLNIIRAIERFTLRHQNDDLNETSALVEWAQLCGPIAMDYDLFKFVQDEIALYDKKAQQQLLATIIELMNHMLKHGMPMEKCGLGSYQRMCEHSRNAEEALLAVLSACAPVSEEPIKIAWPTSTSFGELRSRLVPQRTTLDSLDFLTFARKVSSIPSMLRHINENTPLAYTCFNNLNLEEQELAGADFYTANLHSSSLIDADLAGANLSAANLRGANLTGADLKKTDLKWADLTGAKLTEAKLRRADLTGARLTEADLTGAVLTGAVITLTGEVLTGTNLRGADLTGADLTGTNLKGANLEWAKLTGAKISQAQIDSAIIGENTILPDGSSPGEPE